MNQTRRAAVIELPEVEQPIPSRNGNGKAIESHEELIAVIQQALDLSSAPHPNALLAAVNLLESFIDMRIRLGLRLNAIDRGVSNADEVEQAWYAQWHARLMEDEKILRREVTALARAIPIIQIATTLPGVAEVSASKVIARIDISRADTVSALWRFAGYGVVDGEAERKKKGEKSHFDERLKKAVHQLTDGFIKHRTPYRDLYDAAKERYALEHPDWSKGHLHMAAIRVMKKMWLSHLWETWRKLEGLPTPDPFVFARLGHQDYVSPQAMGWPET